MLKHDAAVGAGACHRLAVDKDRAGFDRQKAADQIKQGGFAAAGRAEQRDKFAVGDLERNLVERQHLAAARRAIEVVHTVDDDLRACSHCNMRAQWPAVCQVPPRTGSAQVLSYNVGHQSISVFRGNLSGQYACRSPPRACTRQPHRRQRGHHRRLRACQHAASGSSEPLSAVALARTRTGDAGRLHRIRHRIRSRCAIRASGNIPNASSTAKSTRRGLR